MKKNLFLLVMLFCLISRTYSQTDPYPYRGLYVDKFVRYTNYASNIDEPRTLLGRNTEEDSLLNFARDNDFKYLILYDINRIFNKGDSILPGSGGRTYKQSLCDFIIKAKTQFCIEHIGAAIGSTKVLDSITDFNSLIISSPYSFSSPSTFSPIAPNPISFVQNNYTSADGEIALRSELVKTTLRLNDFNSFCSGKIDVVTTEYEFWQQYSYAGCIFSDVIDFPNRNTLTYRGTTYSSPTTIAFDNQTSVTLPADTIIMGRDTILPPSNFSICRTNAQFWSYRQFLLNIQSVQSGATYPFLIDTYLGWFSNDSIDDLLQSDIIDSLVDRIGLHTYNANPTPLWGIFDNRDFLFGHNNTPNTIVHPILSSEQTALGGEPWLGIWLSNQAAGNTLFEAEKTFMNGYFPNAAVWHGNNVPLHYGAFNWFAQSFFKSKLIAGNRYFLQNKLFQRPSITCAGQNVFFNYIGPNESGMTLVWNYADGTRDSIVNPDTTQQNRNHIFPASGSYVVQCTAYYPAPTETGISGCIPYTYKDTIFINGASITANGSTTFCQGGSVQLTASSGNSYYWTTPSASYPTSQIISATENGTYTVAITSSNGCANSTASIFITVIPAPTTANAGPDQFVCNLTTTTLAGNNPSGIGIWNIISGTGGLIGSPSNPVSSFSGINGRTYTLSWTISNDPCPSSSDTVLITFNSNPTLTVSVNQNQSCPSLNDGSATANPTPSVGIYEYYWSQKPLILTQSITGLPALTQTVYVTNTTTQCSSNPAPFTINPATPACNNATYHVCASPTNVSSYYGGGFAGGTSTTHIRVAIHNDFFIDNNFTIQYADITIDPGVRIIVNQNKTLNIASSNLTKCTTPWQGIVLNTGSVITVTNSSEIDDAIVAVDAPGGSTINLWNSSFFRNDVSAYIHSGDFTNKVSIYGNHFDFQNTDFYSTTATNHINVQQANNVLIGSTVQGKNYFTHASTAINILTSRTKIRNNEFYDLGRMIYTDALTWVNNGIAINVAGTGTPYSFSEIGGTLTNEKNIFHNLDCFGIVMQDNVDVNIRGNDFYEINHGIEFSNMASRQINIKDNSFKNFSWGIYGVELTNSTLDISRNRFNMISTHDTDPTQSNPVLYSSLTRYGGLAISIQSNVQSSFYYNCHNNWIANCITGIHSRNLRANNLLDIIAQHNQIFYTHPENEGGYGYEKGIWMENCNKNQISNNHIRSTTGIPDTIYERGLTGIRFDLSPNNQIKENFIKRMGYGMYGSYGCTNTELHCNSIEDYCDGINGYHLDMSEQGDAGSHVSWKNQWNGIRTGPYRISGSFLQNVRWNYLTPGPENVPSPAVQHIFPSGNGTIDPSCTVPTIISGVVKRDKFYEEVAFESAVYNSDPLFNEYESEILFYSGLNSDTTLLHLGTPDDIVYQEKYSELKNRNIGKFELVNTLIKSSDFQTALTTVNSITDDNIMEQYKKKTLQIYLDCRINGHKPTISQKAILGPIANQLGVYGGTATYFARALLNIFVDENHSTLSRMRAPVFYTNGNKKSEKEMHSKLNYIYPNPANNELNFLLQDNLSSDKHIQISDCYGSSMEWIKWVGKSKELTINTENFNAGVYFVTLIINNEKVQTDRVVIIH